MLKQNDRLASVTMKIAKEKLGTKELTGHNDGKFVSMIQRWLAKGAKWMDNQPWCACFATWCVYQAADILDTGVVVIKPNGSSTSLYAQAKQGGFLLMSPIPNCIGLMRGTGGTKGKTHHHTFFVESVDFKTGFVRGIDGNWKNAVSHSLHRISECDFVAVV